MRRTLWLAIALAGFSALLSALLAGPAAGEADTAAPGDSVSGEPRAAAEPWTIRVIRLEHAKAEQLAETLARVLPPGTTLVPDRPTNSLLISGPPSPAIQAIAPE
jgi:hypothetical protein